MAMATRIFSLSILVRLIRPFILSEVNNLFNFGKVFHFNEVIKLFDGYDYVYIFLVHSCEIDMVLHGKQKEQ